MLKNTIKYPSFSHLKINHKEIKNDSIIAAYDRLTSAECDNILIENKIKKRYKSSSKSEILKQRIIVADNSSYSCCHLINELEQFSQDISIELNENSFSKLCFVFDLEKADLTGGISLKLGKNAKAELVLIFLKGKNTIFDIHADLDGENSELALEGAYYCAENSDFDLNLEVNHNNKNVKSSINMNGVLSGNAVKSYKYCLDFPKGCSGSKGDEKENVVALSDSFRNTSVPILLVGEDEIEASHGASLEEANSSTLDYIYSRGIDEGLAKFIYVNAKFSLAFDMLNDELRAYSKDKLEKIMREI